MTRIIEDQASQRGLKRLEKWALLGIKYIIFIAQKKKLDEECFTVMLAV